MFQNLDLLIQTLDLLKKQAKHCSSAKNKTLFEITTNKAIFQNKTNFTCDFNQNRHTKLSAKHKKNCLRIVS